MDDSAPVALPVSTASTGFRLAMLALSVAVWLACFAMLRALGTWTQFVVAGVTLASVTLACDAGARALLRPSLRTAALGLGVGLLMVALTHAAFALLSPLLPAVHAETARLLDLAQRGDFSAAARGSLIVVIAGCEEVIFRGALLSAPPRAAAGVFPVGRGDALRIAGLAAAYAAAMLTLGSLLLLACAFGCALVWGALRVATGSLAAPMIAHVIWDLGVLIVWPLLPASG